MRCGGGYFRNVDGFRNRYSRGFHILIANATEAADRDRCFDREIVDAALQGRQLPAQFQHFGAEKPNDSSHNDPTKTLAQPANHDGAKHYK